MSVKDINSAVFSIINTLKRNGSCASCDTFQLLVRRLDLCDHMACDNCLKKAIDNQCPVCHIIYWDGYSCTSNNLRVLLDLINSKPKEKTVSLDLFALCSMNTKRDSRGEIFLHRVCRKGFLTDVEELVQAGSDINLQNFAGWTPLHEAVTAEHEPVVKALLQNGALVNIPGPNYTTALHIAVQKQHVNLIKLLVKYGADLLCFDKDGNTPIDLCYDNEQVKTALCLSKQRSSLYRTCTVRPPKVFCVDVSDNDIKKLTAICGPSRVTVVQISSLLSTDDVPYVILGNQNPNKIVLQAAMLQGSCIVRVEWINKYVSSRLVLYPLDYLADVPGYAIKAAAMNAFKQLPKLFDGLHFYFHSNFMQKLGETEYTVATLKVLVQLGGGKVVRRLPTRYTAPELTYPYHALKTSNLAATTHYIIYADTLKQNIKTFCNDLEVKHKSVRWLIKCINNFAIVP